MARDAVPITETPGFRKALLEALPTIPGVRSLGETSTGLGRSGLGFSAKNILGTTTVVVDPRTGALLEARNTDDDAFTFGPQANVDIQWLDPTGTPKVVGHGSLPPRAILRSPPNQAVNVTFKSGDLPAAERPPHAAEPGPRRTLFVR